MGCARRLSAAMARRQPLMGSFMHITGVLRKNAECHSKDAEARFTKEPTDSSYRNWFAKRRR